jgi:hypothetical protein
MNRAWGFLVTNNVAPVWMGELGAALDDSDGHYAADVAWANTLVPYMNGQMGAQGGPTFSGNQQPVGSDWWLYGDEQGQDPNGTCNFGSGCNSMKSDQGTFGWKPLLFNTSANSSTQGITIGAVSSQTAAVPFTMSGTLVAYSNIPNLEYSDNGGPWTAIPTTGGRNEYNQPGSNKSVYNTPIGSGAVAGAATDADTIDIARGWNGSSYFAGPVGIINSFDNYGGSYWIGKSTDGTYSFSADINGRSIAPDNGSTLTASNVHLPNGTQVPGPSGSDNPLVFADPTSFAHRQYTFGQGTNIQAPGLQPGDGPFHSQLGEWDCTNCDNFGEDQETGLAGYNIGAGQINFCDVDPNCNPAYPEIHHAFRYSTDARLLKTNDIGDGNTLKPDSWPQRFEDYQGSGAPDYNIYRGNLKAGTTLFIPQGTSPPSDWNAECKAMYTSSQKYPWLFRDVAGGGMHLTVDQVADKSTWVNNVRGVLAADRGGLAPDEEPASRGPRLNGVSEKWPRNAGWCCAAGPG